MNGAAELTGAHLDTATSGENACGSVKMRPTHGSSDVKTKSAAIKLLRAAAGSMNRVMLCAGTVLLKVSPEEFKSARRRMVLAEVKEKMTGAGIAY